MILLTGASGFIGKNIAQHFSSLGVGIVCGVRVLPANISAFSNNFRWHAVGEFNKDTDWQAALQGVEVVVHCAARVHVFHEQEVDALAAYRTVNVSGTISLARQAAASGVKRFIFLSSIGVHGNKNSVIFSELSAIKPYDAYTISKFEAEQELFALAMETGMEIVILRPPLVYGPGAPGNFASLVKWVQRGLPLPLGAVKNKRSLIAIDNLVSFVLLCADRLLSPSAANQVFLVSDGVDVSTASLIRRVAKMAGKSIWLIPVPVRWLHIGASLFGKSSLADRLLGNLQVDSSKARTLLGWRPAVTMEEQLVKMFKNKD